MLESMRRWLYLTMALVLAGCSTSVYVRDGVTDGDTFYLAPLAIADNDPALQSWVAYSLIRSACQLDVGGDNPARVSTYDCELRARRNLLETWQLKRDQEDPYLDTLLAVDEAGFLEEYVVYYLGRANWQVPIDIDLGSFGEWRRSRLGRHRAQTRLVGSWGYRERPAEQAGQ